MTRYPDPERDAAIERVRSALEAVGVERRSDGRELVARGHGRRVGIYLPLGDVDGFIDLLRRIGDVPEPTAEPESTPSTRRSDSLNGRSFDMAVWRRSSYSDGAECIEAAQLGDGVIGIRRAADPGGPTLLVTRAELAGWVYGVQSHQFDDLIRSPRIG